MTYPADNKHLPVLDALLGKLAPTDLGLEACFVLVTRLEVGPDKLLRLFALGVRIVASKSNPAERLEEILDGIQRPPLLKVIVPQDVLILVLLQITVDKLLDQLDSSRPERLGIIALEMMQAFVDETQDLSRLLGLLTPHLLEDAFLAGLHIFQSLV